MANQRIPDQPTQPPPSAYEGQKIGAKRTETPPPAPTADTPPPLNFATVIYGTLDVCEELYSTMATTTPSVLLQVLQEQSSVLGGLTSASEAPGICAASLSVLQSEESQVETMESQTQSAIQASDTAAQQVGSMVISFVQTLTQLLAEAGKAPS